MKAKQLFFFSVIMLCAALTGCAGHDSSLGEYNVKLYDPQYALGFEILGAEGGKSSIIVTKTPWQGADSLSSTMLFVARDGETPPSDFKGQVLQGDARRVVCMSSSYIAMLDAVGAVDRVVGVSGIDFITNPYIQAHRADIPDVGYDNNIDYELILAADPDLVLLYGIAGTNMIAPKLEELGIPYMYVGEYLEEDPLGKAEWLVAIGEAVGLRQHAQEVYAEIPKRYDELCQTVKVLSYAPTVMVNTPFRDSWVMAPADSYVGRLIRDAGGLYLYKNVTQNNQSMPIDMEEAYKMVSNANFWINVGSYASLDALKRDLPKFADVRPVVEGNVWNTTLHVTPGGGNDYWESGVVNPDLVLRDLIMIFHPGLIDADFTYYKKL